MKQNSLVPPLKHVILPVLIAWTFFMLPRSQRFFSCRSNKQKKEHFKHNNQNHFILKHPGQVVKVFVIGNMKGRSRKCNCWYPNKRRLFVWSAVHRVVKYGSGEVHTCHSFDKLTGAPVYLQVQFGIFGGNPGHFQHISIVCYINHVTSMVKINRIP